MKVYVIKNKERKYLQLYNDDPEFDDEIYNAFMYYSKKSAEKDIVLLGLKDCKVVEITIAEGDLEEELAEKDKEIKSLKQQIENNHRDYVSELAYYTAEENIKEIRKQVCDEIRDKVDSIVWDDAETVYNDIHKILDQIEKGEGE